jgi:hypothetical protein
MRACRIDYEIQSKKRDPEAASSHQFFHLNVHTDFLHMQVEGNQLALKTDCGILLLQDAGGAIV